MARAKKGSMENPVTKQDLLDIANDQPLKRDYKVLEAAIKDDFCNYIYEITGGHGVGNKHKVTSKVGYIKDELSKAFAKLNVHLATIDDVFKHAGVEFENIHTMHGSEFTTLYTVTGFKIGGSEENESIILIGNKYVSGGGRIALESPKIFLDDSSSYKWYYELRTAAIDVRNEVAKYHEGNYEAITIIDGEEDPDQLKMSFAVNDTDGHEADMSDFENAEV